MSGVQSRLRLVAGLAVSTLLLAACEVMPRNEVYSVLGTEPAPGVVAHDEPESETAEARALPPEPLPDVRSEADFYEPGTGRYAAAPRSRPAPAPGDGDVTLNFQDTNLLEVVKVILGDLLGENYVVEPGVQGVVTMQTSRALAREALLPTLEMLLRMNEAALVLREGVYRVVPRETAHQGSAVPQLGGPGAPLPQGFSVRVVPLRYVSATEMQQILEPFTRPGNVVRVDAARNLLILGGPAEELRALLETIEIFDVDWLAGRSVALFTPDFVDAKTLAQDLEAVFGTQGETPLADLLELVVIERLDALLVISTRPEYLEKVRDWIFRLDRDSGAVGRRLYVYRVHNGKALDLAAVLNQVFEGEEAQIAPAPEIAPGLDPVELSSSLRASVAGEAAETEAEETPPARRPARAATLTPEPASGDGLAVTSGTGMRIIADEINNALVIMANAQEYRQVEAALKELDAVPLQVLIEVTIAEVILSGELSQGIEWFFKNHVDSDKRGVGTLDLDDVPGLGTVVPGFSYALFDSANAVRAVLNLLAADSRANIISSPSLMVLNNQQASIQVGDEVPVTTTEQSGTDLNSNLVNNIEYKSTGVLLTVTPRVNPGGLVIMEVEQEVSNVVEESPTLTPTVRQRRIRSTVAVQSRETVVLGGLIRENKDRGQAGIPGLYKLPVIGAFFGRTTDKANRTELVVLITPRAVQGSADARAITDEFRNKMQSLQLQTAVGSDRPRLDE
jgi:general secretion pathway protein D